MRTSSLRQCMQLSLRTLVSRIFDPLAARLAVLLERKECHPPDLARRCCAIVADIWAAAGGGGSVMTRLCGARPPTNLSHAATPSLGRPSPPPPTPPPLPRPAPPPPPP